MSMHGLLRFWTGELPVDMRTPGQPYVVLLTLTEEAPNQTVQSFYMTPSRLLGRTLPRRVRSMPAAAAFEELRFESLAEGFVSTEGVLNYAPLFDSGSLVNDLAVRLPAATPTYDPESVRAMRGRRDWVAASNVRGEAGRYILQLASQRSDLLPFGRDAKQRSGWPDRIRSEVLTNNMLRLTRPLQRGIGSAPVLLIDASALWKAPYLVANDLLAYNGANLRDSSFSERQRILAQEIGELRGDLLSPQSLARWDEVSGEGTVLAAAESPYGADLITDIEPAS